MTDPAAAVALATTADVDRLVEQWLALVEHGRESGLHIEGPENELAAQEMLAAAVGDERVFLARVDGSIVGFCMLVYETGGFERDVSRGVVENLYVDPEYRGQGFGTALLDAGERRLAEAGAAVVAVEVMAADGPVRRFYRDRDYREHRVTYEKRVGASDSAASRNQ